MAFLPHRGLAMGLLDKRTNRFMRILFIHSDNIKYEFLSKTKMAEENILPKDAMQDVLGVRCDESMEKKVREVAVEWVSYTIVIGDGAIESGKYYGSIRSTSQSNKPFKITLSLEKLITDVRAEVGDMPHRPIYTPKLMNKRARYY